VHKKAYQKGDTKNPQLKIINHIKKKGSTQKRTQVKKDTNYMKKVAHKKSFIISKTWRRKEA
jgi:hypothetical protein